MQQTHLYQLLSALSPSERKQACLWVASPLHNRREDLLRLVQFLCKKLRQKTPKMSRELTFAAIFPGQAYSDQLLRLSCSRLLKCLEEWLSWRQLQTQPLAKGQALLEAFRELDLPQHFQRQRRSQGQKLVQSELRHHAFHLQRYQLEQEVYHWESHEGRGKPLNLQEQEVALQTFFISSKLRLACLTISHERVTNLQYQLSLLPEVLRLSQEEPYYNEPAISIYRFIFEMYQAADTVEVYRQYGRLLYRHFLQFPKTERRDLLLLGINYCIRQINNKGTSFLREAFELYKQGLEADLLLEDGWLSNFTYTNIAILSIKLGELSWGEQFIQQYHLQLAPAQRASIFALNAARLAYAKKDYRQALLSLHHFDDRDFIHQLSAKIIQLKVYYETSDFQLLAAHIKNTRAFLRRVKDASYHKEIYVNIFSLTDQLMRLAPYDKNKHQALRQQIESTNPLTEREWLLEQLAKI